MAKAVNKNKDRHVSLPKKTSQGGNPPKTSSMNKHAKRSYKAYRGQGR